MAMARAMSRSGFAVVKMGRMLYEMEGVTPEIAKEAMALASHKLPLNTRMVSRSSGLEREMKAAELKS